MSILGLLKSSIARMLVRNSTPLDRQMNELRKQNLALKRERDELAQDKEHTQNTRHMDRMLHHSPQRISGEAGVIGICPTPDDHRLVERVVAAYKASVGTPLGSSESMWLNEFASANNQTHQTLESGDLDAVASMLRDPSSSMLFYGFDSIQSVDVLRNESQWWLDWQHKLVYDNLLQICRATGSRPLENPESATDKDDAPPVEEILSGLDNHMGFRIDFPNIFSGECGIQTTRGIANYRSVQALFQAWRIKQLLGDAKKKSVLEIGAGLGRTAYYALKMGVRQYTIIDIPLTGVAQGYFLGRILGEDAVSLYCEKHCAQVRILPPIAYEKLNEEFDLIINVDSLTEMAEPTATKYLTEATRMTRKFLSINHEHNAFTVESIYRNIPSSKAWRTPYWLRRGYVEELIEFTNAPS
jgi:hypothetical protein